ncbi:glycoprotein-N-acetylgalactosamine 3-beta-galactosyltransferase 1 [Clonorchis sinensis]|uniref:N-acetylgalactosaminide beta-1,3-galactosyltransferase n=1 Tax=Clonorchis sinensis TaxID=79923 RepID=G7YJL6_CLOSI|nr:glycoprotein-N-acetylgalactosamine 3-beta-galactosyltransferase 1 [Clonorchis sinensis]
MNLLHNESRQHLWSKMQAILHHVNRYRDEYDYFYKSDDDAYVVSENLRTALTHLQPTDLFFAGYPFYVSSKEGHLSGGPGYVISREAFKTIMDKAIGNHPACPTYDENKEDVKITMCGNAVGVKLVHLVDRHTTFPYIWRPERRTEYLFQWRGLRHLLDHRFRHKSYQVAPTFDINNPFVKEDRCLMPKKRHRREHNSYIPNKRVRECECVRV